jgi:hypothetical protein
MVTPTAPLSPRQQKGVPFTSFTGSATLPAQGFNAVDNAGASGTVQLTLPTTPVNGQVVQFDIVVAQVLKILPQAGATIYAGISQLSTYFQSNIVGSSTRLTWKTAQGWWQADWIAGQWTGM